MSPGKRRWLTVGTYAGAAMVLVPFVVAAISIAITSRVPDGLRGATHIPALKERVSFALGSASVSALLAPVGILLAVLCGLSLAEERRQQSRDHRPRTE
ncbi:MAG TPA: hypothetical protein VHU80_15960 [Polyangiaceae bacterium]|jgi:ABC-type Fe3+ transport system permease subunit|nr:hypothetical protein [Polyangiaceae bacterium]